MFSFFKKKGQLKNVYSVAFYNLENLFDTINDPKILDDDFTPKGNRRWTYRRYKRKIKKLGSTISKIGLKKSLYSPAIIGVAEVENKRVLYDLIQSKHLKKEHYDFVHYDSSDERGIDVALLYKKELFELISSETFTLFVTNENGKRDFTRDILLVEGKLNGELVYTIVNHWPSRGESKETTEIKRIKAAKTVHQMVEKIYEKTKNPKIIIMGDFNDNPNNKSVKTHLKKDLFYNPMQALLDKGKGSLSYKGNWFLFDQILFSKNFFETKKNTHSFKYAKIFDKYFLKKWQGRNKGIPFRTFIGKKYLGGFSDHFPVYIYLQKNTS